MACRVNAPASRSPLRSGVNDVYYDVGMRATRGYVRNTDGRLLEREEDGWYLEVEYELRNWV